MANFISIQVPGGDKFKKIIEIAATYAGQGIGAFVRNCLDHEIDRLHGIDVSLVEQKGMRHKHEIAGSAKEEMEKVICE